MPRSTPRTIAELSDEARALWAKSGDGVERLEGEEIWLSLPQHMLDSLGVADELWTRWLAPGVRAQIADALELDDDEARKLVSFLAGAHDIGKATKTFQTQMAERPDGAHFIERLRRSGLRLQHGVTERSVRSFHHSLASWVILRSWLRESGARATAPDRLARTADAHHGSPSSESSRTFAAAILEEYDADHPEWRAVQRELLDFVADQTDVRPILPRLRRPIVGYTLTLLTGIIIMADWIASSADHFALSEAGCSGERRLAGIEAVDLTRPWSPHAPDLAHLDAHLRDRFGWSPSARARPVQQAAAAASLQLSGPGLVIIEAPTGEGKTEAALTAAEALASMAGSGGILIAAPTMSTADGLFHRVLEWSHRAADDSPLSMFLGHSKSHLNTDFDRLRFRGVSDVSGGQGNVIASQWMSGRKKGILSNITVATVDQVLFMALQAKHSMLRHLGLAGKVVIIDEVHAYDTYMSEYLAMALEWLARYRVPVILLSATLPTAQKEHLVAAYSRQIRATDEQLSLSTDYPLVTTVDAHGIRETVVESRGTDLRADVELIDDDPAHLVERLAHDMQDGGCVLVLCNTVRRAQEAYSALEARFPGEVELHHAGFIASDRVRKEQELRAQLGPDAHRGGARPFRRLIVATQVAEQSLDIDVDLLVTDIAPIDLIIQRIGRLHRHSRPDSDRPESLRQPRVLIRGVESSSPPVFESGTRAVYDERLLLATLAALLNKVIPSGFSRPDDIAPLVHEVYGAAPPIPADWQDTWETASRASEVERLNARARARTFRIESPTSATTLDELFGVSAANIDSEAEEAKGLAQVRDSDPTIEVIPIRWHDTGYTALDAGPDTPHQSPDLELTSGAERALASATVRLPARFTRFDADFTRTVDQLERETPIGWRTSSWLKGQLALRLDEDSSIELNGRRLRYDRDLGLCDVTDQAESTPNV